MTDDLQRKLATLTGDASFDAGAMQLGPSGDPSAMTAILNAIDDTMLPRHMVFAVGASSVTLSVAGKRLRSVVAATSDLKPAAGLVGQLLATEDEKALSQLEAMLSKLTNAEGTLTLIRKVEPSGAGQADAGVGVKTLMSLWNVDPDAVPPTEFERFAQKLGGLILGGAETDGLSLLNPIGDVKFVNSLETANKDQFAKIRQDHDVIVKIKEKARLLVVPGLLPDEALLCSVIVNDINMLLAVSANSAPEIADAWSDTFGK